MRAPLRPALACAFLLVLLPLAGAQDLTSGAGQAGPEGTSAAVPGAASPEPASAAGTEDANAGGAAPGTGSAALEALQATEPISFSGTMTSSAGGALGWPSNPVDALSSTAKVVGFSLENVLTFDARPDASFRIHGSTDVTVSPSYALNVNELFFDYSLNDFAFVRAGEQALSWANGRVFGTGDLLIYPNLTPTSTTPPSWIAIKGYLPFGADGVTAVALTPSGTVLSTSNLIFAAKADFAFGKDELDAEGVYRRATREFDYSAYGKTSVEGIDLYAQAFGSWTSESGFSLSTLENAYWESSSPRVKIYVEHWYNGGASYTNDNRLAVGLGWTPDNLQGVKTGLLWTHAFIDGSGSLTPVITYQPRGSITMSLGAVVTYGGVGSVYASQVPPGYSLPFSWSEMYSLFLKVDVSLGY